MKPEPFVVNPNEYARALNVVGEKITVLASTAATQGYEIFLQQGDEGAGPPPHSHDWDESFYVIKGTVNVICANKSITATPGTFVHVPGGTVHSFRFGAGGGEMMSVTGQNSNAAQIFTAIDQEIPAGLPDIPKLLAIGTKFGAHFSM